MSARHRKPDQLFVLCAHHVLLTQISLSSALCSMHGMVQYCQQTALIELISELHTSSQLMWHVQTKAARQQSIDVYLGRPAPAQC